MASIDAFGRKRCASLEDEVEDEEAAALANAAMLDEDWSAVALPIGAGKAKGSSDV